MPTPDLTKQLQQAGLPLMVTSELLSIWQEGSPSKYKKLVAENQLLPMLQSLKASLEQANEYRTDPQMQHVSLTEKLQMAELPLTL